MATSTTMIPGAYDQEKLLCTADDLDQNGLLYTESEGDCERRFPVRKDHRVKTVDVLSQYGKCFIDYNLDKNLLKGIYEKGWEKPSPIQEESISVALENRNILARAKNGTGKTGAYLIPMLEKLVENVDGIQAMILVPTRELAMQTRKLCQELLQHTNFLSIQVTGGTSLKEDLLNLGPRNSQKVQVMVGTPSRIAQMLDNGDAEFSIKLDNCKTIVLDEADKLLSTDFKTKCEQIVQKLPADRQIMLFSATFPLSVRDFSDKFMNEVREINMMNELTLKGVTQYYAAVPEVHKIQCLTLLFSRLRINQSIIFCNTTKRVELLAKRITEMGYSCYYIHAKMDQQHRNRVYHDFSDGHCKNLVCTDLFTRGIDIPTVNVVVNFDFPRYVETYLHRIGRSGRFGHLGLAVSFVTSEDCEKLLDIETKLQTKISPIPEKIEPFLYQPDFQNVHDLEPRLRSSIEQGIFTH